MFEHSTLRSRIMQTAKALEVGNSFFVPTQHFGRLLDKQSFVKRCLEKANLDVKKYKVKYIADPIYKKLGVRCWRIS